VCVWYHFNIVITGRRFNGQRWPLTIHLSLSLSGQIRQRRQRRPPAVVLRVTIIYNNGHPETCHAISARAYVPVADGGVFFSLAPRKRSRFQLVRTDRENEKDSRKTTRRARISTIDPLGRSVGKRERFDALFYAKSFRSTIFRFRRTRT